MKTKLALLALLLTACGSSPEGGGRDAGSDVALIDIVGDAGVDAVTVVPGDAAPDGQDAAVIETPRDGQASEATPPDAAADGTLDVEGAPDQGGPDVPASLTILPLEKAWIELHCHEHVPVKIRNDGSVASGPLTVMLMDPSQAGALSLADDTCTGHSLAPQEICTVGIAATVQAHFAVTLVVTGAAGPGTQSRLAFEAVFGDGPTLAPKSGSSDRFPNTSVGSTSAPFTYVFSNAGGAQLTVPPFALVDANPQDFVLQDGCAGQTLSPTGQCELIVRFRPTAVGSRTTTLQVVVPDAHCDPTTLGLTGVGIP